MEGCEVGSVYVFCLELAVGGMLFPILFKSIGCNLVQGQKIVFKIKPKFYLATASAPPSPLKNSGCAPACANICIL